MDEAGDALEKALEEQKDKHILLLFSGGSAITLVNYLHAKILSSHHTISVLDERYTFDQDESNFSILERTSFFSQVAELGVPVLDPRPRANETLEETAKRFDLALKHWHISHRDGVVLATMGIGPDGHTSGILPMPENTKDFEKLFLDEKKCAVGYESSPEKNPYTKRITTTVTYLTRHVEQAIVFASGVPKREVLQKIVAGEGDIASIPAMVLQQMKHVDLYTDLSLA
ncbi:MAG: hypothetical protein UU98_C0007G0027 [Parcubacteria group bacterium GW2011_GWD2_42_14]|nr:MAG: hypothetical protein UU98_C0007G0027 [Parcubacteria group bacterium GW2011_GWD2_42_14]